MGLRNSMQMSANDGSGVALLENIMCILENRVPTYKPEDLTALSLRLVRRLVQRQTRVQNRKNKIVTLTLSTGV